MGMFSSKKIKEQDAALLHSEENVFNIEKVLYPNKTYNGQRVTDISGRLLKGSVSVGDKICACGKEYTIISISNRGCPVSSVNNSDYILIHVTYAPLSFYYKLPFKKGLYKIAKAMNISENSSARNVIKTIVQVKESSVENKESVAQNTGVGAASAAEKTEKSAQTVSTAQKQPEHTRSIKDETFVCDGCGKTMNIKYRYKANLCADCAENNKDRSSMASASPDSYRDIRDVSNFFPSHKKVEDMRGISAYYRQFADNIFSYAAQKFIIDAIRPIVSVTISDYVQENYWKRKKDANGNVSQSDAYRLVSESMEIIERNISSQKLKFTINNIENADKATLVKAWFGLDCYVQVEGTTRYPYITALRNYIHAAYLKLTGVTEAQIRDEEYLDEPTIIYEMQHKFMGAFHRYDVLFDTRIYGWETMKNWADYIAKADVDVACVRCGVPGQELTDVSKSYRENESCCAKTPELNEESGLLSVIGRSRVLGENLEIIWINQTRAMRIITMVDDEQMMRRYVETVARRTFGTEDALRLGKPLPEISTPVRYDGTDIYIDSQAFLMWKKANLAVPQYELCSMLPLKEKEPIIRLFEDGVKTREYCLQTEGDEDFSGKFFAVSVRLGFIGNPAVPVAQIDGFISDTSEERKMTTNDVGYRMEGHFLACGGRNSGHRYELNRGQDLEMKGLKYPGYTTPANIRLLGVCPECEKSFAFNGYAFYMMQSDVAYSDDGLDCCAIQEYEIDKDTWSYEADGKVFRYYNSFNCPHCGTPYIDYKKHPENKVFGVSGCVHLGRKHYASK